MLPRETRPTPNLGCLSALAVTASQKIMLLKCHTQYVSKLKSSSVSTRLEKASFHSNPKEGQWQRMFKLPHNCTDFSC